MKINALLLFLSVNLSLYGQNEYHFTVNPNVDTTKAVNQVLIQNLKIFLSTKNASLKSNPLWDTTDFTNYKYPFKDIYWIETGWPKKFHYYPTLVALDACETENEYVLKMAFMEVQSENSVFLKCIYNILATVSNSTVTFSRYTNYAVRGWEKQSVGSFDYYISPNHQFSLKDAEEQVKFADFLSNFFNIDTIPVTYYSCTNVKEMFKIRGFDYNYQMYAHETGGMAGFNNNLFSGNDRDIYNHEVVHFYLSSYLSGLGLSWNPLLNEGLATYLGGSAEIKYEQHRTNLANYVNTHPDFDFTKHLNPYTSFDINNDTSVPYTIGALICELAYKNGGKDLLLQAVSTTKNDDVFPLLGLNLKNMNKKLRELLAEDVYNPPFMKAGF